LVAGLPATLGPSGLFASSSTVSLHTQGEIRRPTTEAKEEEPRQKQKFQFVAKSKLQHMIDDFIA